MRYEFRGKDWDDEWQEGSLMEFEDGACAILTPTSRTELARRNVRTETVGRYTGLTDNNGKKIFEGDVLERYNSYLEKWIVEGVVEYGHFNCSCCDGVYGWVVKNGDIRDVEYLRVAGNIHDNPELVST